jgi:hypothetical protein
MDTLLSELLTMREDKGNAMGVAVVATGGDMAPKFTGQTDIDRSNAFFIASQVPLSFSSAGAALTGANETTLNDFIANVYNRWNLSPENRAAILAGNMTGEAAIRASYEPALHVGYDTVPAQGTIYTVGFDGDLVQSLTQMASTKPTK